MGGTQPCNSGVKEIQEGQNLVGGGRRSRCFFFRFLNLLQVFFRCCSAAGVVRGVRTSFILCPCRKHWYLKCFRLFAQHTAQRMWKTHAVTSVHAFCDHAKNTAIYSACVSLYNILHEDVAQGKMSQASMPLKTMPRTLVLAALLFLYVLQVADSGLTSSVSETGT